MEQINWHEDAVRQLPKGVFLMVKGNPMTIGWAQFGVLWGKLCATVYVRHSRYTHTLLEDCESFTISVPSAGTMQKELGYCGTHSGRDGSKCEALHLALVPAAFGAQDGLDGCRYHIECRILHRSELDEKAIADPALQSRYYPAGDPHTMYIGEIVGVTEANV